MRLARIVSLAIAMLSGALLSASSGDCPDGSPQAWLLVYEDANQGGDNLGYEAYEKSGDYEVAVNVVSLWWNDRISSLKCVDGYPAHWWIYDAYECGTLLAEGDGSASQLDPHNDATEALKFKCPADKDWASLEFCENENYGGSKHAVKLYKDGSSSEIVWEVRLLDGHWNDRISSIETGLNGTLTKAHAYWYFYKDADFNNAGGGQPDLVLKDGQTKSSLGTLNDKISSMRLVLTDSETAPTLNIAVPILDGRTGIAIVALMLLALGAAALLRQHRTRGAV
jgi:hypothetical protein